MHVSQSPRRMSAYMKLFGDEVKYIEITQESITKFEQDIADLLMGTKAKIEYADAGKKPCHLNSSTPSTHKALVVSIEKIYQTLKTVLNHISTHLKVRQNDSVARRYFQLSFRCSEMWSNTVFCV